MYALTYTFFFSLAVLVLVVLKLFGVIHLGWLWLYLSYAGVTSMGSGLILVIFCLRERRHAWQPREK